MLKADDLFLASDVSEPAQWKAEAPARTHGADSSEDAHIKNMSNFATR